jgi:hypothetical protein
MFELECEQDCRVNCSLQPHFIQKGDSLMDAQSVLTLGSFMSVPEAVKTAPVGLHHALKLEYASLPKEDGSGLENVVISDRAMFDLSAIDMTAVNPATIIKDCEYIKAIVQKNPDEVIKILAAFQSDAPISDMGVALDMVKSIGLTEEDAVKAGGGLIVLGLVLIGGLITVAVTEAVKIGNQIKYKQAVARASGKDFEMQNDK